MAIPPYFHLTHVSLATASAVSGASIGMLGIPFLLQHLLDMYGLRAATLLSSCLWLSVSLAGALFGQGVVNAENKKTETFTDDSVIAKTENGKEHSKVMEGQSNVSKGGLIYSRRTSLLPASIHYRKQQHKHLSSLYQRHDNSDKSIVNIPITIQGPSSNPPDNSRRCVEIDLIRKL